MTTQKHDFLLSGFVYFVSAVIFFYSRSIASTDSKMLPLIVASVMTLLATMNICKIIFLKRKTAEEYDFNNMLKVIFVLLVLFGYMVLVSIVGLFVCTPFFILAVMYILGQRDKRLLVLVPLLTTTAIIILFNFIFLIQLPAGRFNIIDRLLGF